ncbi:transglutaminase [Mesorhizobium sp. NBSH29]|uniref:transglutaminase-like cysteine peptidase n=1 Tax=Mesorhizobium sp. NBSH29 TaxID=2654249 RepID=UPI00189663FD|nr:transglutaminase-like cysteine peptidase [Mesorhizobium sp. NBSH29]QPC86130.1 transglutaminase [Mesorhizobium sp. NBSH29]
MVSSWGKKIAAGTGSVLAALAVCGVAYAAPMQTGGLTSQPIGHFEFCKSRPAECSIRSVDLEPARMSAALLRQLTSVNLAVNAAIKPMNDIDLYGKDEVWTYPREYGDCEDYVLEKRRILMKSGVSTADLLITVVRKTDGEGHAVLTVRTDKGDYILDNLHDDVRPWEETGYRYLKRQAADHTGRWVSIRGGESPLVGSVQ